MKKNGYGDILAAFELFNNLFTLYVGLFQNQPGSIGTRGRINLDIPRLIIMQFVSECLNSLIQFATGNRFLSHGLICSTKNHKPGNYQTTNEPAHRITSRKLHFC